MATKLTRPVRREVASISYGPLIVTIAEEGIYFREKGRRTAFLLPHGVAYQRAVSLELARRKAERAAARKARRRSR